MNVDARVEAWASLHLIKGVGPRTLHQLLKSFGSAVAVREASAAAVARVLAEPLASALIAGPDPGELARSLKWLQEEPDHHLVAWDDADYPSQLLQTADAPPVFYYVGRRELLSRPSIAIVGSRNATPQGRENAFAFAQTLSDAGLTIVSGLALGIDTAAHRGGLAGKSSTIAVVGTGIDRVYPARNRDLAHELAKRGGIISEFPFGTPPLAANFPRRNRVISGIAKGCLVVEATLRSGSLITARLAGEEGREVLAIPGSIHSPFSKGCHRLIKEGAKLVETAQDVLVELGYPAEPAMTTGATGSASETMDAADRALLETMGPDPVSIDVLCAKLHRSPALLSAAMLKLELNGHVAVVPGGLFQRISA